ncbi:MAG: DUF3108 domain-containing protein [Rhodocyclaceae bacterium]|nr:DUF3108 domain-containing protein [Rhodocyclaceae bacterium]
MARRIDRALLGAFVVSALAHVTLVAGPGWDVPELAEPEALRIEAQLVSKAVEPPAAEVVQPLPPPASKPRPKPRPKPKPRPAPEPTPQAPAATIGPSPPTPEPEPASVPAEPETPRPEPAQALPDASAEAVEDIQVTDNKGDAQPVADSAEDQPEEGFAGASALPREARIAFSLILGNIQVGEAFQTWRRDERGYRLRIVMETTGAARLFKPLTVTQTSAGSFYSGGLRPRRFSFEQTGRDTSNTTFDWKQMRLTLDRGSKRREFPLEPGAQDVLSLAYQLGAIANARGVTDVAVASGRNFYRNALEWVGEDTVRTRAGEVRTLHVRTTGRDQTTEVWLAPELQNLPVRIMFTDRNGTATQLVAEHIEADGQTLLGKARDTTEQAKQQ